MSFCMEDMALESITVGGILKITTVAKKTSLWKRSWLRVYRIFFYELSTSIHVFNKADCIVVIPCQSYQEGNSKTLFKSLEISKYFSSCGNEFFYATVLLQPPKCIQGYFSHVKITIWLWVNKWTSLNSYNSISLYPWPEPKLFKWE